MIEQKEQIQRQSKTTQQPTNGNSDTGPVGDGLLERAREEQADQASLLSSQTVEGQYSMALAAEIESKRDQAGHIEEMLEDLVEQQSSRLQQARSQPPGLVSLPGSRTKWQLQVQQQQSTLQRLQGRLEMVREIRDGMGLHGPRIEELAERKMRKLHPGLARDWDDLQEEERRNLANNHLQELELRRVQTAQIGNGLVLSNTLTISTRP